MVIYNVLYKGREFESIPNDQGSTSQRVRTSPNLRLVLGDKTNCMDSPKLGRVTSPNSR